MCWWVAQLLFNTTVTMARLSVSITLLQIILDIKNRAVLYLIATLSTATGIGVFFFIIFRCIPVNSYWTTPDRASFGDHCVSAHSILSVWYLSSAIAAFSDLTLAIVPILTIWQLRLSISTKLALAVILGFGCIATVAVIARIPFLNGYPRENVLYDAAVIETLSYVESSMLITAGGIMLVRPALRLLSRRRDSTGNDRPGHCSS
ncbi:hypothetical protein BDW59DRAFT_154971 [Aspergillus cavernicola]|uniref:Rhodopsin domain-containing protein n=1 Tax=Aspergillus cavernicola TaxID=176166 RepID=A0ABR4HD23_9EURO